jgi:UDP-N-acetylglucosamine 2-epimerase (non-hydrolysing)
VDTGSNTVRDSLDLCEDAACPLDLPAEPFGVVSLHRFELLNDRRLLTRTVSLLAAHARSRPLLWVDHPVTVAAIDSFGLGGSFDDERLVRIPRLGFCSFVPLMRRAAFLVTDSGGSQEECFYLDLPCLVHRKKTERREGLGENVVLSGYREDALKAFLRDPSRHRRRSELPAHSPSDVIVADLVSRGYA